MDTNPGELLLEHERTGNKVRVTVRWNKEPAYIDTIDPANATHRQRFIKALAEKLSQARPEVIEAELLRIADAASKQNEPAAAAAVELDVSRIVRPESFISKDVTGLTVPVVKLVGSRPTAQWALYLRWADGRRECQELTPCIDLPDSGRLWVHPLPAEPSMSTAAGWSAEARRAWLERAAAPDPAEVFRRVCEQVAYYLDLPPDVAAGTMATLALWSVLTYCYQAWDAVPYLYVGGPLNSGKTRVFEILNRLVFRPLQSSNLTGPALFRTLHDRAGVLLLDEAERLRHSTPDVQEILSMLLAGYKRGGQATRLEAVGETFRPVAFDVYGPKALACIAGLPPALASRCIPVTMFRAGPDSPKPRRRIDAAPEQWQLLRDDLHSLALEHGTTWLDLARRPDVCPPGIDGRSYELWQPLLALAWWVESHGAQGLLDLVRRHALTTIDAGREDAVPEADEVLLELLTEAVRAGQTPTAGELLARARDRDPNTFGTPDGKGLRWQPNTVTRRLKTYGIPAPRKSNGERRYRCVSLVMLWRIQRHYGLDLGIAGPAPTPGTPPLTDPADPVPVQGKGNGRVGEGR
jgi:hypothetical protein